MKNTDNDILVEGEKIERGMVSHAAGGKNHQREVKPVQSFKYDVDHFGSIVINDTSKMRSNTTPSTQPSHLCKSISNRKDSKIK